MIPIPFTEDTLEKAIIEQFQSLDYEYLYGPDIERDYCEVILKDYFFQYVPRINKGITEDILEEAYNQIKNYQLDIPSLFYYNAFNVISDGVTASMGTISADFTIYMVWKSREGEAPKGNFNPIDVLLQGVFRKDRLLDIIRNYIVYEDVKGNTVKIVAGYHQYFAVTKAVSKTKEALANNAPIPIWLGCQV